MKRLPLGSTFLTMQGTVAVSRSVRAVEPLPLKVVSTPPPRL
jgi:hypothetical protein